MRRRLFLLTALLLVGAMLLTACGGSTSGTDAPDTSDKPGTSEPDEKTQDEADADVDPVETEPVVIKWATWENAVMAREMAEKFSEKNPDIIVEVQHAGWFGNDVLTKWAASGEMPDVFAVENPFLGIQNGWFYDLKPFIDQEAEPKFYPNFIETGTYKGKVYMLPSYIYLHGILVNKTLLKANNIPIPDYGWTIEDYKNILIATTEGDMIGTNTITELPKHIPPQMNDNLGWGCWDGEKYVLGEEWISAVNFQKELHDAKVYIYHVEEGLQNPWELEEGPERDAAFEAIKNAYKEKFGEEDAYSVWLKGNAATWMEFSWGLAFEGNEKYSGFDWDYYPFPVVERGDVSRPGIVCDSVAMLANTEHPEQAYRFIKYISFDPQAFDDRVDVIENYDPEEAKKKYSDLTEDVFPDYFTFGHIPAINDQDIRDRWCDYNNVKPGLRYMLDNMDTGYIDGFKYVPDFDTAYHKTIEKAVIEQVWTGQKTAADLAAELEMKANEITQEAISLMGD
jgi:multiple sugar transport system substrate-binding protein